MTPRGLKMASNILITTITSKTDIPLRAFQNQGHTQVFYGGGGGGDCLILILNLFYEQLCPFVHPTNKHINLPLSK